MADKLDQVAIRMVEQPPLYSNEPMNNPDAAIRVMNEFLSQMDRELFCIVNLQADLTPINMNVVSVGALNEAMVHPREIFKSAILSNAQSMMLIHNHPSGNLTPSKSDVQTTARMQQLGELMGIPLIDHIITGRNQNYYSFRDKGEFLTSTVRFSTRVEDVELATSMAKETNAAYKDQANPDGNKSTTIPLPVESKDIDSIMQSLETGVEELFTSDRYREFLKTMAKFHNYSFNNTMLIAMQRPDATLVTSYKNWQSIGRQVMKGEKGITIIAPAPYKKIKEKEVLDENQRPVVGTDGKPKTEQVEVIIPHFKAVTVFDIAQTSGEPIQTLTPELLTGAVKDFDSFMKAIQKISPVPIRFDEIDSNANGYYHTVNKEIVIKKDLSESQTLKTAIHETVHAKLHDKEIMESLGVEKDRLTKEVEAESVAYCVCSSLGLDTSDYSFPYIAGWSSSREMKEMKVSMDVIRKTAGEMIDQLKEELEIILEEKQISYFVAECSEFPVLGEAHYDLTLSEAIEIYEKIPSNRMNGQKCIGFDLKDGSDYEGMFELYVSGSSQRELIDTIPHYRQCKLIQKALDKVESYMSQGERTFGQDVQKPNQIDNSISHEKSKKAYQEKESVLGRLSANKEVVKMQERRNVKQNNKMKSKGGQELD